MASKVQVIRVNRVIRAPLKYVFDWCTDFRETDPKIIGSARKRVIIEKTRKRVIFAQVWNESEDNMRVNVDIVTLSPPDSWHLDMFGSFRNETAEYKLKNLGKDKTELRVVFKNRWREAPKVENAEHEVKRLNDIWDAYADALERDYARTPARTWQLIVSKKPYFPEKLNVCEGPVA